jgi:hypothetical protein
MLDFATAACQDATASHDADRTDDAVWDGLPARSYGGTADVVEYARQRNIPVQVIWPAGASAERKHSASG